MRTFRVLAVVCFLLLCRALPAHSATPTGWQVVQALPLHTLVQVRADTHKSNCHIMAVTDDQLTCAEASFSRAEIKSIRLPSKTRSMVGCFATGAAIGAGAGAITLAAPDPGPSNSWFYISRAEAAGIGAGVGSVTGGVIGVIVGATGHHFSKTIYQR